MTTGKNSYRVHCTGSERDSSGAEQPVRRCLDTTVDEDDPVKLERALAEIVSQTYPGMRVASYEPIENVSS